RKRAMTIPSTIHRRRDCARRGARRLPGAVSVAVAWAIGRSWHDGWFLGETIAPATVRVDRFAPKRTAQVDSTSCLGEGGLSFGSVIDAVVGSARPPRAHPYVPNRHFEESEPCPM